jgi:hypothetical protein
MTELRDKVKSGIENAADRAKSGVDRVGDAASEAREAAGGVIDSVKQNAQSAKDTAVEYAGQARDKVREWAGDAGRGLGHSADRFQHLAEDAYEAAGDRIHHFGREVNIMVRRHPIPALLIGFGLGMLIGRMTRA